MIQIAFLLTRGKMGQIFTTKTGNEQGPGFLKLLKINLIIPMKTGS